MRSEPGGTNKYKTANNLHYVLRLVSASETFAAKRSPTKLLHLRAVQYPDTTASEEKQRKR